MRNAKKSKGQGLNDARFMLALASDDPVEIPKHANLTPEEAELWPLFASARARTDWREFDLVLLTKVVKLEALVRRDQQMLESSGSIVRTKKGTPIVNPLIAILDSRTRLQLAIVRTLSLTAGGDPRTARAHGAAQRTFNQMLANDDDDLFAKPQ